MVKIPNYVVENKTKVRAIEIYLKAKSKKDAVKKVIKNYPDKVKNGDLLEIRLQTSTDLFAVRKDKKTGNLVPSQISTKVKRKKRVLTEWDKSSLAL